MIRQKFNFLIDKNCTICFVSTFILEERIISKEHILNHSPMYIMRKLTIMRSQMINIYPAFHYRKYMIDRNPSKIEKCTFSCKLFRLYTNTMVKCKWKIPKLMSVLYCSVFCPWFSWIMQHKNFPLTLSELIMIGTLIFSING